MSDSRFSRRCPEHFIASPAPDKPPFKSEGDVVAVGDLIGLDRSDEVLHRSARG